VDVAVKGLRMRPLTLQLDTGLGSSFYRLVAEPRSCACAIWPGRLPQRYWRSLRIWCVPGIPARAALVIAFHLTAAKPARARPIAG
jgi:hypothetical protein